MVYNLFVYKGIKEKIMEPLTEYFGSLVFDDREIDKIPKEVLDKVTDYHFDFSYGKDSLSKLKGFNIIFRAPSCMPTREELKREADRGAIVTTEIEQLMKIAPCKIIGITGSDGKTTTTTIISEILKEDGKKVHLGGNIGEPLLPKINSLCFSLSGRI